MIDMLQITRRSLPLAPLAAEALPGGTKQLGPDSSAAAAVRRWPCPEMSPSLSWTRCIPRTIRMKTTPAPWPLWLCNVRRGRQSSALVILACHGVTVHFLVTPPTPPSPRARAARAGFVRQPERTTDTSPVQNSRGHFGTWPPPVAMSRNVPRMNVLSKLPNGCVLAQCPRARVC